MRLPEFRETGPLRGLDQPLAIPNDRHGAFPGQRGKPRAFVLFRSGRRIDLLNPSADSWTDEDLACNLARISRWGGASKWPEPLSVAQHSLFVLCIREQEEVLEPGEALRELLHDASEGLLGWDPIGPLKAHLGEPFRRLERRLQAAVAERYELPPWDTRTYRRHKAADRLAAASEARHVVGWSRDDMRHALGIEREPLEDDPISMPGLQPWQPWPARLAEAAFLRRLRDLRDASDRRKSGVIESSASTPSRAMKRGEGPTKRGAKKKKTKRYRIAAARCKGADD